MEQNCNHLLGTANGSARSKEQEARASMTKSTSGLSSLKQKETIVTISGADKGCYFTRVQVGVFVFALLLTLSAVVVLVVSFSGSNRHFHRLNPSEDKVCQCTDQEVNYIPHPENTVSFRTPLPIRSTSEPLKISDQPEIGIRLPGDVIPVHYDIELDVRLEDKNYTGSVKILTNVYKNTNLLILHVKPYILKLNETEVYIYPIKEGQANDKYERSCIAVVSDFMDFDKEIHAFELKEPMLKGTQYIIYIRYFKGFLLADLKGMYLSSYKNKHGEKR